MLGHTRWASVGSISEANAHPLNQEEAARAVTPYVIGALNGDVDNFGDLIALEGLEFPPEITTDAKVIPALVSRRIAAGEAPQEAFRATVAGLDGSLAIGAQLDVAPNELFLSLRGSGQALYVGLAEDAFVVASEPYGLVEETSAYVRMDGETPGRSGARVGHSRSGRRARHRARGHDRRHPSDRVRRNAAHGDDPRDPSRGHHHARHPSGQLHAFSPEGALGVAVFVPQDASGQDHRKRCRHARACCSVPRRSRQDLRDRVRSGKFRRVVAIGQGTAAIAAQGVAATLTRFVGAHLHAEAMAATELSGFGLADDMSDTLVVAISQSGTTTDTNRTVDLVRARNAAVLAIVNRRNSDLVDKSDGVLYTSDGRDLEMAVPSTKAFYAQIAAGYLLALALAGEFGDLDAASQNELLVDLRALPDAMEEVLAQREAIAAIALRHVPSRRYWTVVGNGLNRIAANELRIKLSELCYRSISSDIAEDKKHIDLCTEPLILVCAVGLGGSNADDVAKEVAYHRAHRAAPIVITTRGEDRFSSAVETIEVPPVHGDLGFVLSAMAGHLFGFEAALVIDASARPLREARAMIQEAATAGDLSRLERDLLDAGDRLPRRAARQLLRRQSHRRNRGEDRVAVPVRNRDHAARSLRGRSRQGRHARCRRR